jgi:hypothetical protein
VPSLSNPLSGSIDGLRSITLKALDLAAAPPAWLASGLRGGGRGRPSAGSTDEPRSSSTPPPSEPTGGGALYVKYAAFEYASRPLELLRAARTSAHVLGAAASVDALELTPSCSTPPRQRRASCASWREVSGDGDSSEREGE